MAGDVWEGQIFGTEKLDWRAFEKRIMLFADVSRVFYSSARLRDAIRRAYRSLHGRYRGRSAVSLARVESRVLTARVQMIPT